MHANKIRCLTSHSLSPWKPSASPSSRRRRSPLCRRRRSHPRRRSTSARVEVACGLSELVVREQLEAAVRQHGPELHLTTSLWLGHDQYPYGLACSALAYESYVQRACEHALAHQPYADAPPLRSPPLAPGPATLAGPSARVACCAHTIVLLSPRDDGMEDIETRGCFCKYKHSQSC